MAVESNPLINGAVPPPLDADGTPLQMSSDGFSVPHITTFASIYSSAYRTYLHERFDEALKKNPQYALDMQRDPHLMGCLQERKLAVVSKKWHLEVDNPKDKWEALVRDGMTTVMDRTPFLKKFMWSELDALWFGKAGNQVKWWWQDLALEPVSGGMPEETVDPVMERALPELMTPDSTGAGYHPKDKQRALCVQKWKPVHGDKFGHKFDGTPYILITPWVASQFQDMGYETTLTTRGGYGLVLNERLRDRFVLHSHELVDEDFFEAEKGEAVFGLGLRDRLFWSWWLRQEYLGWVVDFLERVGLGVTVWYYDASNPTSKAETEKAAKEQSRRSVILCPVWPDRLSGRGTPLIDRLETPTGGAEVLQAMIQTMRDIEQRLINGQDMSSQTKPTGIGSEGQAAFKQDTKFQITAYDCENLAESLTGSQECPSLLSTSLKWTFPWCDFPVRWKFNVDTVDPQEKLEAVKAFVEMGGSVIEDEARALTGMSDPQDDDVTLGGKDQLMASMGIGPDGKPIAKPGEEGEGGEEGMPGNGKPDKNGKGPEGKLPVMGKRKFARNEWGETVGEKGDIGHYVTIGGEGGHVVFIEGNRVTKGAPELKGKEVKPLRGGKKWEDKAKEHSVNANDLHQLASDFLAHHNEFGKSRQTMLQAARKASLALGYDLRSIVANSTRGKQDANSIRFLDDVAQGMADRFPEHFHGHEDKQQRLYDMLLRGNPEPMKAEQAYEQALEHLVSQKEQELVPFKDQFARYAREIVRPERGEDGLFIQPRDNSPERETLEQHNRDRFANHFHYADPFTGVTRTFDEKGDYNCGRCNMATGSKCLLVKNLTIDRAAGSCGDWENIDAGDSELPLAEKTVETAGYGVAKNGKGFGCHRCPFASKAFRPDSQGRDLYCGKGDMRVFSRACCSLNGAPVLGKDKYDRSFESAHPRNEAGEFVEKARKSHGEWAKSLTRQEKQALEAYSSAGHLLTNQELRSGLTSELAPLLDAAIAKAPATKEAMTLYRGVASDVEDEFEEAGYTSASAREYVAKAHAGEGSVLRIHVPAGTQMASIDAALLDLESEVSSERENEYILPRGAKLKVTKRDGKTIHAELVK